MASNMKWVWIGCVDLLCLFLVYLPWIVLHSGVKPYHRGFYCDDESLAHPFKESTISGTLVTILGLLIPISAILVIEGVRALLKKKRGERVDYYKLSNNINIHPVAVTYYKLIITFLFGCAAQQTITNIGKYSVGRLRPHFLDVCRPNYTAFDCKDVDGHYRYVEEPVCTGASERRNLDMRLSFPSGHSSLSSYCMVFLVLYLQARLTWKGSRLVKPLLQVLALWATLATCLSRISDYKHHWSDVLSGALLGVSSAVITWWYVTRMFLKPNLQEVEDKLVEMKSSASAQTNQDIPESPSLNRVDV